MAHSPRFLEIVEKARAGVKETTVSEVVARIAVGDSFHLVDVREESEYAAGHVQGAVHIGKGVIERDVEAKIPDLDADIVLYCGGGFRSVLAAESLAKMGYTKVKSMAGGWREWVAAKGPTE
jgi:rhodanese-related sulfurtransferase